MDFQRNVGYVVSAIRPKDTFDESAQVLSPCEDDVRGGLVDGQVEGRIAVQMEGVDSEVVLKSAGNNNEGACDMLC